MKTTGPSFIGIGAQRAGSSWLADALGRHPSIFVVPRKEVHYFDSATEFPTPSMCASGSLASRLTGSGEPARNWRFWLRHEAGKRGLRRLLSDSWWRRYFFGAYDDEWYRNLFPLSAERSHAGEITPGYTLLGPDEVRWAKRVAPDAKILMILRNPVERDWSHYRFAKKWEKTHGEHGDGNFGLEFLDTDQVRRRSDYASILETWRPIWEDALGIFSFEEMEENPAEFLKSVLEFLNVADRSDETIGRMVPARIPNQQEKSDIPNEVRLRLAAYHEPMLNRLSSQFPQWVDRWRQANRIAG